MPEPRVSVVIPTYNREAYLAEAIDSALSQEGVPHEVIVVDDGSTDGTGRLLEGYAGRLRALSRPTCSGRPGVPANLGVSAARAPFVAFLDSDDRWYPGKLRRQIARLERTDAGFSYGNLRFLSPDGTLSEPVVPAHQLRSGDILQELVRGMFVHTSTFVVRRQLFLDAGGIDEELPSAEYYPLLLRLAALGPADCVAEPLADVRRHPGQHSELRGADNYEVAISALAGLLTEPPGPLPSRIAWEIRRSIARHETHLARRALRDGNTSAGRAHLARALRRYPPSRVAWATIARYVAWRRVAPRRATDR